MLIVVGINVVAESVVGKLGLFCSLGLRFKLLASVFILRLWIRISFLSLLGIFP